MNNAIFSDNLKSSLRLKFRNHHLRNPHFQNAFNLLQDTNSNRLYTNDWGVIQNSTIFDGCLQELSVTPSFLKLFYRITTLTRCTVYISDIKYRDGIQISYVYIHITVIIGFIGLHLDHNYGYYHFVRYIQLNFRVVQCGNAIASFETL